MKKEAVKFWDVTAILKKFDPEKMSSNITGQIIVCRLSRLEENVLSDTNSETCTVCGLHTTLYLHFVAPNCAKSILNA